MTVQEYGINFTQLSMYGPHMLADSKAQMNKLMYGVSDIVRTRCRKAMFREDMNIFSLMTYAQ